MIRTAAAAFLFLEAYQCSRDAVAAIAERDPITPAKWMADAAAKEAVAQCGASALPASIGELIHAAAATRALATIKKI